jgi:hypothetical protein
MMKKLLVVMTVLLLNICSFAQSTTLTLPTADITSSFNVTDNASTPKILLNLNGDAGFYLGGIFGTGTIPTTGGGTRMMWYPAKGAFRAGGVSGTEWDDANVGQYSIALGYRITASAYGSTALGFATSASGQYSLSTGYATGASGQFSTAIGNSTTASGSNSTAMGYGTTASGESSIAMGYNTTASGSSSTSMGNETTASNSYSTAMGLLTVSSGMASTTMGLHTVASGSYSLATGFRATASGDNTTAMGNYVSTNSNGGSFILGDISTTTITCSTTRNEITMRFAGGYRLFTSSDLSTGVTLAAGGGSWSSVSDSTKKENIIKADGELFLTNLSRLKIGSWNYKTQDKNYRHYGPMAQEIFYYYGKDEYGEIGNDTTLASADMDGIMMICLQALEKRTEELKKENEKWKMENEELKKENDDMKNKITGMLNSLQEQNNKISNQQNMLQELATKLEFIETKLKAQENKAEILSCNNTITTKDGSEK